MLRSLLLPAAGSLLVGTFLLPGCASPGEPHRDAGDARAAERADDVAEATDDLDAMLAARAALLAEAALERGQAYTILQSLVAAAPQRLSGSEGAADAVRWGVATMQRLGLENIRLERFPVPRWERGDVERLVGIAPDGAETPYDILALGGSVPTPAGGVEGEVVMVRSFEQLRALGRENVEGKIVFHNRPMPRALLNTFRAYGSAVPQRTSGASEAARLGAVASITRSMTTQIDDFPHTGAMRYADGVPQIPSAAISTLDAEHLAARIRDGERVRLRLELDCRTLPDVESANVVGEIVGTEFPDEIVVIGGHLDAWDVGHGAHDDGSGISHCLEAARLILAEGLRPKRTIRVVLFMNEENGLRGGRDYALRHRDAMDRHVAAIESDRGGFEPRGFDTTARGERFEALARIVDALDVFGAGALIPGGGGADIGPMRAYGVTLLGLVPTSQRYFDFHHSERDTIDMVHERELALGAAALAHLASAIAEFGLPPEEEGSR